MEKVRPPDSKFNAFSLMLLSSPGAKCLSVNKAGLHPFSLSGYSRNPKKRQCEPILQMRKWRPANWRTPSPNEIQTHWGRPSLGLAALSLCQNAQACLPRGWSLFRRGPAGGLPSLGCWSVFTPPPSPPALLFLITVQAVGSEHTWDLLGSTFQEVEGQRRRKAF